MERTADLVERAYQIAPFCKTLKELKIRLRNEGYLQVEAYFISKTLRKQVRKLLGPSGRLQGKEVRAPQD